MSRTATDKIADVPDSINRACLLTSRRNSFINACARLIASDWTSCLRYTPPDLGLDHALRERLCRAVGLGDASAGAYR